MRRRGLLQAGLGLGAAAVGAATPDALLQGDRIVLFRHAEAPGGGDPPGFRLDDCRTQRNLSEAGRAQARQLGERVRAAAARHGTRIGAVWTSQWCRCRDTAELAFPGLWREQPAFNSFFSERERADAQTAQALALLRAWRGPGLLLVVTHQVNITALTGVFPSQGEGIVLQLTGGRPEGVEVLGRF